MDHFNPIDINPEVLIAEIGLSTRFK